MATAPSQSLPADLSRQTASTRPGAVAALGLVYVDDFSRGYGRVRDADGDRFTYLGFAGRPVRAAHICARLDAIALPPAYADAWYCPNPRGHIQALGTDARGRRQYRYHPDFRAHAEEEKFSRCADFGHALPTIRRRVDADLARRDLSRDRVIAAVVRLLDSGSIRVGNRQYARTNKSFGATTLRNRHASVSGDRVQLDFVGKSGKRQQVTLADRRLAGVVRRCRDLPGQELFQYLDADGTRHPVGSTDVNDWLHHCCGDFTAKAFRTWHASVIAFAALADSGGTVRMQDVLAQVAACLGNTPAVARKSYVHPLLLAILSGEVAWHDEWAHRPRATRWLSRDERGLLALLDSQLWPCTTGD